jgi:hypothetical protein
MLCIPRRDLRITRSVLWRDEALLLVLDTPEWKPTPEETFLWVVTKTSVRWVKSELGTKALSERVAALRCGLDPSSWDDENGRTRCHALIRTEPQKRAILPFDLGKAHELYEAVFKSIEDEIRGKSLLKVPSGPLAALPFGVLVMEDPAAARPETVAVASDGWCRECHNRVAFGHQPFGFAQARQGQPRA